MSQKSQETNPHEGIRKVLTPLEKEEHGLSISEISRRAMLNRNSTAKYLNMLVSAGRVEMRTVGPAKVYRLSSRIPVSNLFRYLPDPALTIAADLRIRTTNTAFCTLLDLDPATLQGVPVAEIKNPFFNHLARSDILIDALRGTVSPPSPWTSLVCGGKHCLVWVVPAVFEEGTSGALVVVRPGVTGP
jgi:hypothetical protein